MGYGNFIVLNGKAEFPVLSPSLPPRFPTCPTVAELFWDIKLWPIGDGIAFLITSNAELGTWATYYQIRPSSPILVARVDLFQHFKEFMHASWAPK